MVTTAFRAGPTYLASPPKLSIARAGLTLAFRNRICIAINSPSTSPAADEHASALSRGRLGGRTTCRFVAVEVGDGNAIGVWLGLLDCVAAGLLVGGVLDEPCRLLVQPVRNAIPISTVVPGRRTQCVRLPGLVRCIGDRVLDPGRLVTRDDLGHPL